MFYRLLRRPLTRARRRDRRQIPLVWMRHCDRRRDQLLARVLRGALPTTPRSILTLPFHQFGRLRRLQAYRLCHPFLETARRGTGALQDWERSGIFYGVLFLAPRRARAYTAGYAPAHLSEHVQGRLGPFRGVERPRLQPGAA